MATYIDALRRKEIKDAFLTIKTKLNERKGKEVKLIKFEVFTKRGWQDYSAAHPTIGILKTFLGISNEYMAFQDAKGIFKLEVVHRLTQVLSLKDNILTIAYNDENECRWYNGLGMRLTYEFPS